LLPLQIQIFKYFYQIFQFSLRLLILALFIQSLSLAKAFVIFFIQIRILLIRHIIYRCVIIHGNESFQNFCRCGIICFWNIFCGKWVSYLLWLPFWRNISNKTFGWGLLLRIHLEFTQRCISLSFASINTLIINVVNGSISLNYWNTIMKILWISFFTWWDPIIRILV